ncbi:MAG: 50S ribosomal protein L29 [Candidatus Cloacimonetes bacterium]|nr:50S ribosomal protein L29 [Candidatus Cloacimonadota bacterium]
MKAQELREMTVEELKHKLEDLRIELFNLRFQVARNLLDNPLRIHQVKKDTARVLTILTEKKA